MQTSTTTTFMEQQSIYNDRQFKTIVFCITSDIT